MIRAVFFDYGGVIAESGKPFELSENLSKKLHISIQEAVELLNLGFGDLKRGKIALEEFWVRVEASYGRAVPDESRNIWIQWQKMIPFDEILELRAYLQKQGIRTGIISNVEPVMVAQLNEHGFYEGFSPVILSCEVGYAKPEMEIYRLAIEKSQCSPSECIFIDDQEVLLEPARMLGMQTLHARTPSQVSADVKSMIESHALEKH